MLSLLVSLLLLREGMEMKERESRVRWKEERERGRIRKHEINWSCFRHKYFATTTTCVIDLCDTRYRIASFRLVIYTHTHTNTWMKREKNTKIVNRCVVCCYGVEWKKVVWNTNSLCLDRLLFLCFPFLLLVRCLLPLFLWAINFAFCSLNVTRDRVFFLFLCFAVYSNQYVMQSVWFVRQLNILKRTK